MASAGGSLGTRGSAWWDEGLREGRDHSWREAPPQEGCICPCLFLDIPACSTVQKQCLSIFLCYGGLSSKKPPFLCGPRAVVLCCGPVLQSMSWGERTMSTRRNRFFNVMFSLRSKIFWDNSCSPKEHFFIS